MKDLLRDLELSAEIIKTFRLISRDSRSNLMKLLVDEHNIIGDKVDDPFLKVKQEFIDGGRNLEHKIPYIRRVREIAKELPGQPFYGLKEAKDLVESW